LLELRPDAVVHLAAVAFAPDAAADPQATFAVAVGGTTNIFEAARALRQAPVVLVAGSSEVYGAPDRDRLPLDETSPLAPMTSYALSKTAQESVALAYASQHRMRVVVCRSFSHTGPGQRPVFVVPALAHRIWAAASGGAPDVAVGNLDVQRDISDVRDVVAAYRMLLEAGAQGKVPDGGLVVNVCSGRAVSIRWIVEELCRMAGARPVLRVDPELVRAGEAPELRGDPKRIRDLVGWQPAIPITQTLADVWASIAQPVVAAAS
jgi:GDP-4-dehydro-6-deoxy-D-mannose reductase